VILIVEKVFQQQMKAIWLKLLAIGGKETQLPFPILIKSNHFPSGSVTVLLAIDALKTLLNS
jgi:hypothetical protein